MYFERPCGSSISTLRMGLYAIKSGLMKGDCQVGFFAGLFFDLACFGEVMANSSL